MMSYRFRLGLFEAPFVDQGSIVALVELARSLQELSAALPIRQPASQFLRLVKVVDPGATLAIEAG